jgi:hypothetical protein
MRRFIATLALLATGMACARAEQAAPPPFCAAMTRVTVQDVVPFDALVAYPTDAAEVSFQDGPYSIAATRDAPSRPGRAFQLFFSRMAEGERSKRG